MSGKTAEIALTNGFVTLVDAELADWLNQWKWRANPPNARSGYAVSRLPKVGGRASMLIMHRLIMGAPDGEVVDHINGDPLDNRRANLRLCSQRDNTKNKRNREGRQYKGVYPRNDRFLARIMADGIAIDIGYFASAIEAAFAYDAAAKKHHGEFARLNFDPKRDWICLYSPAPPKRRVAS